MKNKNHKHKVNLICKYKVLKTMKLDFKINQNNIEFFNKQGVSYHVSKEQFDTSDFDDLLDFVKDEIQKKINNKNTTLTEVNFNAARSLGFCEYGIKDFCDELNLDINNTYKINDLRKILIKSKDLELMFRYVDEIIKLFGKEVFKPFENEIIKDAQYSYFYAKFIIKGRFKFGEDIISKDAKYSYYYARDILNGRWIPGETAINKNPYYCFWYNENLIK